MQIVQNYLPELTCVRSGILRPFTTFIAVHWAAGPGQSAKQVGKYYAGECLQKRIYASANACIDDTEIVELMPIGEMSYGVGAQENWQYTPLARCWMSTLKQPSSNYFTFNIECSHDDWEGRFNEATVDNLVEYCRYLFDKFQFNRTWGVVRHFDITGKDCPHYYVKPIKGTDNVTYYGRSKEWADILERIKK